MIKLSVGEMSTWTESETQETLRDLQMETVYITIV